MGQWERTAELPRGLTQEDAPSPSCAAAPDGPQPGGEMGTGLGLGDLSLPGSSDPSNGVPGEGVKSWVLRSRNCFLIFHP